MTEAVAYDVFWMPSYGCGRWVRFYEEHQDKIGPIVQSFMCNYDGVITIEEVHGRRETILTITKEGTP